ncbi:hypothetical protein M3194_18495 [Paenibacillus glycanilyticus]|uniref:hypothetical protein n=1 Tax=Paenibacillus glycanilyticus TaxID=126569 RepID=UPI00203C3217|nr:hypothetical protein [Paenibacillus glycanilyticus]MCM3629337.1 hypothetical protein [Paenibacillus glycanilyticus]
MRAKLLGFVSAVIAIFIFWLYFSHGSDETWWSIYRFRYIGNDDVIAKISWFKVSIFAILSIIIGYTGSKISVKRINN